MLPTPEVPLICEGENILNLHLESLLENVLPIFDPVFPYATGASAGAQVNVA
jgi:hypothetical protein